MGRLVAGPLFWVYLASIVAATYVGAQKKHPGRGFVLGVLLSWLGVVLAIFLDPPADQKRHPCPFCAEAVLPAAKVCPHCRSTLN